jgi:hypothetical protein
LVQAVSRKCSKQADIQMF